MYAVQQPLAASTLEDVMGVPVWKSHPSWFLVAENDQAIPPDAERLFAKRMGPPPSKSHPATSRRSPSPTTWSSSSRPPPRQCRPQTNLGHDHTVVTACGMRVSPPTPAALRPERARPTDHERGRAAGGTTTPRACSTSRAATPPAATGAPCSPQHSPSSRPNWAGHTARRPRCSAEADSAAAALIFPPDGGRAPCEWPKPTECSMPDITDVPACGFNACPGRRQAHRLGVDQRVVRGRGVLCVR